jgi:hypothetical protein
VIRHRSWFHLISAKFEIIAIILVFSVAACSPSTPTPLPVTQTPEAANPSATATTDVFVPSPSPEANLVILLAPPGVDPQGLLATQNLLSELSSKEGLSLETRTELTELELDPSIRLVIVLPPDPGIANLAAANPNMQFLAIGIDGLEPGSNLSLIGSAGSRPDQRGFLAGYLAAVITEDWRVGVISRGDTTEGNAARLGFINGAVFFCGLCRPAYPPFLQYPYFVELPDAATQVEQQAAVDQMVANAVKTVYVSPGTGDASLLEALAQAGIVLIGGESPSESLREQWAASIRLDQSVAIEKLWPALLKGEGGNNISAPITLTDVNSQILTPGRQRLVEQMLSDLLTGYIDTGVDPQTGQLR